MVAKVVKDSRGNLIGVFSSAGAVEQARAQVGLYPGRFPGVAKPEEWVVTPFEIDAVQVFDPELRQYVAFRLR